MIRLEILRMALALLVIGVSISFLVTDNERVFPYLLVFMGALMLVSGVEEIKKEKKYGGYIYIGVCLFLFFVYIQGAFLS